MATFDWHLEKLSVLEQVSNQQDVVSHASFMIKIVKDDGTNVLEHITVPFRYVEGNAFTPYEELTEETIFNWLGDKKSMIENDMLQRINNVIPQPVVKSLPWVTQ
jgi:hypothetical protein